MKLRIGEISVRLRLTRPEVERFASTGRLERSITFAAGGTFTYCVERTSDEVVSARFDGARMTISLPAAAADAWTQGDDVGIEASEQVPGGTLHILVEKDFACLKPRDGEDTADHYPHPSSGATC